MKLTQFDDLYPASLGMGGTTLIISDGSNSGSTGGDLAGDPGDYDVVGLGGTVSLGSNLSTAVALGDVLTIIQVSPVVARFATSSNSSSSAPAFNGAKGTNTAGTTMTDATETVVPYATEDYDTAAYHDTSTDPSRMTVPTGKDGYYHVIGHYELSSATYTAVYGVLREGAAGTGGAGTLLGLTRPGLPASTIIGGQVSWVGHLSAGQYVELFVNQSSSAGRALSTGAGRNWLALTFIGT
jgi:hypothetical protein